MVFARGDRGVDFFVVLEGSVEITDGGAEGREETIHIHADRQFTGELDLFNDREILVSGRTGHDSHIVRIPRAQFRRLIEVEPDNLSAKAFFAEDERQGPRPIKLK